MFCIRLKVFPPNLTVLTQAAIVEDIPEVADIMEEEAVKEEAEACITVNEKEK